MKAFIHQLKNAWQFHRLRVRIRRNRGLENRPYKCQSMRLEIERNREKEDA